MRWKIHLHLEAWACELQGETITNVNSSGKIAAPVSSRQFPRQSGMANLSPDSAIKDSNPFSQEGVENSISSTGGPCLLSIGEEQLSSLECEDSVA